MSTIGYFMFHVIGITVLVMIAVTIAAISLPRRSRRDRAVTARTSLTRTGYGTVGSRRHDG